MTDKSQKNPSSLGTQTCDVALLSFQKIGIFWDTIQLSMPKYLTKWPTFSVVRPYKAALRKMKTGPGGPSHSSYVVEESRPFMALHDFLAKDLELEEPKVGESKRHRWNNCKRHVASCRQSIPCMNLHWSGKNNVCFICFSVWKLCVAILVKAELVMSWDLSAGTPSKNTKLLQCFQGRVYDLWFT